MELADIEGFVAVATNGGFTHAAELMYLDQSTVSRRVRRLEDELGTRLIDRAAPAFALTPNGTAVLEKCRRILDEVAQLKGIARDGGQSSEGAVRLAYYGLFRQLEITDALRDRLDQTCPGVTLDVHTSMYCPTSMEWKYSDADVVVSLDCELPHVVGSMRRTLAKRRLMAFVQRGHAVADKSALSIADLDGVPLLTWQEHILPGLYKGLMDAFAAAGVQPYVVQDVYNFDLFFHAVQQGVGVGIMFEQHSIVLSDSIVQVPLVLEHPSPDVVFQVGTEASGRPAVAAVVDALTDIGLYGGLVV